MNIEILNSKHIHGKNLRDYAAKVHDTNKTQFDLIINAYEQYRSEVDAIATLTHDDIIKMVNALNDYRIFAVPTFDKLENAGQVALGYTIMEEFFYLLFSLEKATLM